MLTVWIPYASWQALIVNDSHLRTIPHVVGVAPVLTIPTILISRSLLVDLISPDCPGTSRGDGETGDTLKPTFKQLRDLSNAMSVLPSELIASEVLHCAMIMATLRVNGKLFRKDSLENTLQVLIWDPEAVEAIGSTVRYHVLGIRWIVVIDVDHNVIRFTTKDNRVSCKVHNVKDNSVKRDIPGALSCLSKGLELILKCLHPIALSDLVHREELRGYVAAPNLLSTISNQMISSTLAQDIPSLRLKLMELFEADGPFVVIHKINMVTITRKVKLLTVDDA